MTKRGRAGFASAPEETEEAAATEEKLTEAAVTQEAGQASRAREAPAPLPYVEDIHAKEIYADGTSYVAVQNGLVSITLVRHRYDNSKEGNGELKAVVIGRLTMPVGGVLGMVTGVGNYLSALARAQAEKAAGAVEN